MAWIYLAESEDSPSLCPPGSDQSPTVRTIDTLKPFYCPECEPFKFPWPQFGTTCERCEGFEWVPSISSTEASHARTSALQALEQAWQASEADLCLRSLDSLANASPDSSSWRTSQLSLFEDSTEYSWNSMRWGMMHAGRLFQPQKWEPRTSENGSGFLPTPTACDYGSNNHGVNEGKAQSKPSLGQMARQNLWPTPTVFGNHNRPKEGTASGTGLSTAVKTWPTPRASEASRGDSTSERNRNTPGLESQVNLEAGSYRGALNPTWVEWLMGYPLEWTALEAWAIPFVRKQRVKPSKD